MEKFTFQVFELKDSHSLGQDGWCLLKPVASFPDQIGAVAYIEEKIKDNSRIRYTTLPIWQ